MKIAILAHALRAGGGISVGKNLIRAILKAAPDDEFFISIPQNLGYEEITGAQKTLKISDYSIKGRIALEFCTLPKAIKSFAPNVIMGLGNALCRCKIKAKNVLLVHNAHIWTQKKEITWFMPKSAQIKMMLQQHEFRQDIAKTDLLLVQTEHAANKICQMYGYNGKIMVTPHELSNDINKIDKDELVSSIPPDTKKLFESAKNAGKFRLFYLTRYYPHKNIEILFKTVREYKECFKDIEIYITISREHGKLAGTLLDAIKKEGLGDKIINLGPIAQKTLPWYYKNCDAIIMPTLLESYGIPYQEAMHLGAPILTSNLDFAKCMCGDAAIYFAPHDTSSVMEAIKKLKDNKNLREELIAKGKKRAAGLYVSWDEIAGEMMGLLR